MVLFFVSCSKKQNETSESTSSAPKIKLMGEWTWVESRTGWGALVTPAIDSIVKLKLTDDSTYVVTLNNQIKYSGRFSTFISPSQDSSLVLQCDNNFSVHNLRFRNTESVIYFKNDSCRFYDYQIMDGSSHLFTRVQ
jgi:hypothetical protein